MIPSQHSLYSHLSHHHHPPPPPPPPDEDDSSHNQYHDHHQVYLHPFLPTYESSSFPFAVVFGPCQKGSGDSDHRQEEVKGHLLSSGSSDEHIGAAPRSPATMEVDGESIGLKNDDPSDSGSPNQWMSSKMRLMKRMMNSDKMLTPMSRPRKPAVRGLVQDQLGKIGNSNSNSPASGTGTVRVCSDCNTTKTPLWRSGPRGPKSLCNACGIRQRKARRAMAAAAALKAGGVIPPSTIAPAPKARKEKRPGRGSDCSTVPFKKRFRFTAATAQTRKKLRFDDLAIGLRENSAFIQRALPQLDEKEEAAILLMALSCGLICG